MFVSSKCILKRPIAYFISKEHQLFLICVIIPSSVTQSVIEKYSALDTSVDFRRWGKPKWPTMWKNAVSFTRQLVASEIVHDEYTHIHSLYIECTNLLIQTFFRSSIAAHAHTHTHIESRLISSEFESIFALTSERFMKSQSL